MLLNFTESLTGNPIAINPAFVVAVFTSTDPDHLGKTIIGVQQGTIMVGEGYNEVVGAIQGALK